MQRLFMNKYILLTALLALAMACKTDKKSQLCRKWKTVALKNAKMEQDMQAMQIYLDTVGQNDPTLKEVVNLDSLKMEIRAEMQRSVKEQQVAMENMFMEFRSNGVVVNTSIDGQDSAYFTLEGEDIKIDEAKMKGFGETMTIMALNKDSLKLRLIDFGDTSYVQLVPGN
jgi:hypothetical protein